MAGVVWLTAKQNQNEEDVAHARITFVVAVIGLIVEFILWAILTTVSGMGNNTPVINVEG